MFFVVKPFYQRSWDGDKGSADDFLNGETVWNPRPCCFGCSLPALQPHSFPPLAYFQEHLLKLFPLLMAGNVVRPQHTQLDLSPGLLSMTLNIQNVCDNMLCAMNVAVMLHVHGEAAAKYIKAKKKKKTHLKPGKTSASATHDRCSTCLI